MKEAELKLKTKQDEVKKAEELLNNSTVTSPITGRVQKINESATTDDSGKPAAYIVIQQSGSYRVKGVLGELQRGQPPGGRPGEDDPPVPGAMAPGRAR